MPDRDEVAHHPYVGMIFHYRRTYQGEEGTDWVIMIEELTPNGIKWMWKKGISTLEQAQRGRVWNQDEDYFRHEWEEWLLNLDRKYGTTEITILGRETPSWEV